MSATKGNVAASSCNALHTTLCSLETSLTDREQRQTKLRAAIAEQLSYTRVAARVNLSAVAAALANSANIRAAATAPAYAARIVAHSISPLPAMALVRAAAASLNYAAADGLSSVAARIAPAPPPPLSPALATLPSRTRGVHIALAPASVVRTARAPVAHTPIATAAH
eukprot:IDg16314t1